MARKKFVFCQISRYICTRRIQFTFQNLREVSFSNYFSNYLLLYRQGQRHIYCEVSPFSFSTTSLNDLLAVYTNVDA